MIGFRFVEDHQADYRVRDLCRLAGVSHSGFYAWKSRRPPLRSATNAALLAEIREIHRQSRCTCLHNRSRHQRALDDRTPAEAYAASRAA